jgi:fructokinase
MTPMSGALDWLAVGDVAEERNADNHPQLGGIAARLAACAAALGATTAIVGKVGDDEPGRRVRETLQRLKIDLRWLRTVPRSRTTVWGGVDGQRQRRRIEQGVDLNLRLDELPPSSVRASLTVVSGYSLVAEPARSAAMGALSGAGRRGGRSALLLEAELLWATNARTTRRVLEPALAIADSVALSEADARLLFGPASPRQALKLMADLGPRSVYLIQADGEVIVREGSRVHPVATNSRTHSADPLAGPAAFWVGLSQHARAR